MAELKDRREIDFAPGENTFGLKVIREVWERGGEEEIYWQYDLPDGVVVLALTRDRKVVGIKKWRPGVGEYIQIPAETVEGEDLVQFRDALDHKDAKAFEAVACRIAAECLLDETGYAAGRVRLITTISQHSGKTRMVHAFCLAEDCIRQAKPQEEGIEQVLLLDPPEAWRTLTAYLASDPSAPHGAKNSLVAVSLGFDDLGLVQIKTPEEYRGAPTVVMLRGLPLTGKTQLGRALAQQLASGWTFVDVDEMRTLVNGRIVRFGQNPWENPAIAEEERRGMKVAYTLMHDAVRLRALEGWNTIVAATYSRQANQRFLLQAALANPDARIRTIRLSFNDTPEEVQRRIDERKARGEEGGCQSVEHYFTDKRQRHDYTHVAELGPLLELDTTDCAFEAHEARVAQALEFIRS